MTSRSVSRWVLLADSQRARLVRCGLTPQGRLHVDEVDALRHTPVEPERGRQNLTAPGGRGNGQGKDLDQEEMHRFAHRLMPWLERRVARHGIAQVQVFTPRRALGVLRREWPEPLRKRVVVTALDLTNLTAEALARHAAIRALVGRRPGPVRPVRPVRMNGHKRVTERWRPGAAVEV